MQSRSGARLRAYTHRRRLQDMVQANRTYLGTHVGQLLLLLLLQRPVPLQLMHLLLQFLHRALHLLLLALQLPALLGVQLCQGGLRCCCCLPGLCLCCVYLLKILLQPTQQACMVRSPRVLASTAQQKAEGVL